MTQHNMFRIAYLLPALLLGLLQGCGNAGGGTGGASGSTTTTTLPSAAVNITLSFPSATVSPTGTATLTITLTDAAGTPIPSTRVTLKVIDGVGNITDSVITNSSGQALATYSPDSKTGTATIEATVSSTSKTIDIAASAPPGSARNIRFTPGSGFSRSVYLATTGTPQSSVLTFTVTDENGGVIEGAPVTFTTPGAIAGYGSILPTSGTTNALGQVNTVFTSGNVAGLVQVLAATTSSATSTVLTVGDGYPDLAHLSIASTIVDKTGTSIGGTAINLPGRITWDYSGVISVTLADRFGNPLGADWGVTAYSPFAGVASGNGSLSAASSVAAGVTDPLGTFKFTYFPRLPVTNADLTVFQSYESNGSTPDGLKIPILIMTNGNDSYVDVNGNGVYDSGTDTCPAPGQLFCDQGTPYASVLTPDGEYEGNNPLDISQGDFVIGPASGYIAPSNTVKLNTPLWYVFRVTMSGAPSICTISQDGGTTFSGSDIVLTADGSGSLNKNFIIRVTDYYGAALASNNTITATAKGATATPSSSGTSGTGKTFGFNLSLDNPGAGKTTAVSLVFTYDGINGKGTIPCPSISGGITGK